MMFEHWDHGTIVTIGALVGGILTKILTGRQRKVEITHEETTAIRKELRDDVTKLEVKMDKLSLDLDQWKEKYYRLADENMKLRLRCQTLEKEVEDLRYKWEFQTNLISPLPPEGSMQPL